MLVKTSELIGNQLDWAVAKCLTLDGHAKGFEIRDGRPWILDGYWQPATCSTSWSEGGPTIDRERITLFDLAGRGYSGYVSESIGHIEGPTQLITAMRCYVASKLGNEVEVPQELL